MFENLSNIKEKAQSLLAECTKYAEENNNPQEANLFKDLAAKNEEVIYQIAIIGFANRGKSTLLNVLLGRSDTLLAPVKTVGCTATITKYLDVSLHPQRKETAIVEFKDGGTREIDYEELNDFINNKQNNDNEKGVKCIRVYGHFPLVRSSVAIVDTPGKGSVHRKHDIIAEEFLPMADAIILAQAADLPMDADEKQFLSSLSDTEKKKIITVITKVDSVDEKGKRASCDFVKKELASIGVPCSKVYCTAAKMVLDARKEGFRENEITEISRTAGITELENAIISIIEDNSDQRKIMAHHLNKVAEDVKEYLDNQKKSIEDQLLDFTNKAKELKTNKEKCFDEIEKLKNNSKRAEYRFKKDWELAVNEYCNNLNREKPRIIDRISNSIIENAGILSLKRERQQLPHKVFSEVTNKILDSLPELNNKLEQIIESYSEDLDYGLNLELYDSVPTSTGNTKKTEFMTPGKMVLVADSLGLGILGYAVLNAAGVIGTYSMFSSGILGWLGVGSLCATSLYTAAAASALSAATGGVILVFAPKLIKEYQLEKIKGAIHQLVGEAVDKQIQSIRMGSRAKKDEIFANVTGSVQKKITELDGKIAAIKDNDSAYKNRLDSNYKRIQELQTTCKILKNSIGYL